MYSLIPIVRSLCEYSTSSKMISSETACKVGAFGAVAVGFATVVCGMCYVTSVAVDKMHDLAKSVINK